MIIKKYTAKEVSEGAGVVVNRVFGHNEVKEFDPFLMLDFFNNENTMSSPGFPWHPHKGIETISYLLRGSIEHEDTLGNKGIIGPGELQWMTAGKGIKHKEMPVKSETGIKGFQFWVNLPKSKKLMEPSYQYMTQDTIQIVKSDTYKVKVISGEFGGKRGPIEKDEMGVQMLHVINSLGSDLVINREEGKNGFLFVVRGNGVINNENIETNSAYTLEPGDYKIDGDVEFIFAQGIPLKEAIVWYGPIVMNTQEEIRQTFKDIDNNTF